MQKREGFVSEIKQIAPPPILFYRSCWNELRLQQWLTISFQASLKLSEQSEVKLALSTIEDIHMDDSLEDGSSY